MSLSISQLTFEHHRAALGIAEARPRISWRFEGDAPAWEQASYDLEIARGGPLSGNSNNNNNNNATFSKEAAVVNSYLAVNSSASLYNPWPPGEPPLGPTERAEVRARAHGGGAGPSTPWSDWVAVETGLATDDGAAGGGGGGEGQQGWGADVLTIAADRDTEVDGPKRPVHFRKEFAIEGGAKDIARARLYVTALGLYEAEINGVRVGDHVLAPGWQSYGFRHVYDTHDVTELLRSSSSSSSSPGKGREAGGGGGKNNNALGIVVGEGWYSGMLGFDGGQRNTWGDTLGVVALLAVDLRNGTRLRIPTDLSWRAGLGPVLTSEIYNGEKYDARLEAGIAGWSEPGFFDSGSDSDSPDSSESSSSSSSKDDSWLAVKAIDGPKGALTPPDAPPVRRLHELKPRDVWTSPSGKTLVDFGQNSVGWLRVRVAGGSSAAEAGHNITLRHAEVLQDDGELALKPLRNATQEDVVTLHGGGAPLQWEPRFTYHGYRYAQVDGWPEGAALDLTAVVVHSDMEETGAFACSHDLLNRFHANVVWSMRGNFVSVPTDCPQRDERLGWTGDAHIFGPASNFLYGAAGFWRGWHRDVWSEMRLAAPPQYPMAPPFFVPNLPGFGSGFGVDGVAPAAVWGDVAVGGPWTLWRATGDRGLLAEQYPQAKAWIEQGVTRDPETGLWDRSVSQLGDWLDPKSPPDNPGASQTSGTLVADAYLVGMTGQLAAMARALGEDDNDNDHDNNGGEDADADRFQAQRDELAARFREAWISDSSRLANRTQTAYALAVYYDLFADDASLAAGGRTLRDLVAENDHLVGTGFAGTYQLGFALQSLGPAGAADFYSMLLQERVPSWLYQVAMGGTTTWERWDSLQPNGTVNPGGMTSFNHYAFGSVSDWIHQVVGGLAPAEPGWSRIRIAPVPGGNITSASASYLSPYGKVSTDWSVDGRGFHLTVAVPPNTRAVVTLPGSGKSEEIGSGAYQFHDESFTA